ncbi:MAG: hypothetical protein AB7P35_18290 [Hyphomonadaceae bacterium]
MARIAQVTRTAWTQAQAASVMVLCLASGMVLPLSLVLMGYQAI